MKSTDLIDIESWCPWSSPLVQSAPPRPGVYFFRKSGEVCFGRFSGELDLVYIGSTKNLQKRMGNHFRRIDRINKNGPLQVAWKEFSIEAEARKCESELLARYERDHFEFPPLNRQEAGKKMREIERQVASLSVDELDRLSEMLPRRDSGTQT